MRKNSSALSSDAESLMPGCNIGVSVGSTLCRACIHERLPRMVLISPLWASKRKGCASDHVGKVLVEKREWTRARPLVKYGLDKSV